MKRSALNYLLGFALASVTGFGGTAFAVDAPGTHSPAIQRLEVKTPTVNIRSWNGRDMGPVVRPVTPNPRFPTRALDPMGVQIGQVHPDTEITLQRQKRSADAELPSCVGDCSILKSAATKAARYVDVMKLKTTAQSVNQQHNQVEQDASKVMWPNSRYHVKGVTRDGQNLPAVTGVVGGLPTVDEQRFDLATNQLRVQRISGTMLPSARAWIQHKNLFVSEPTIHTSNIAKGQGLIDGAEQKNRLVAEKEALVKVSKDQNQINVLNNEIGQLKTEAQKEQTEGKALIEDGKRIRSFVVSAGAFPSQATVTTRNLRLAGENKGNHTFSGTADAYDGFMVHEVESLHQDQVETTVQFAPVANQAVGSRHTIRYRVPNTGEKHVFEMGGVKYYRAAVEHEEHVNDPSQ